MALELLVSYNGVVQKFPVSISGVTLGRSSKATIKIEDPMLSGIHCRFTIQDRRVYVQDLESKNGLESRGCKIRHSQLFVGEYIIMGKTTVTLNAPALSIEEKKLHKR
jgi:pSer/pThr/pTyr-binding forkhead associated (FHA) protein